MVSRLDLQKRRQWEARYKRFRASGLTVERFCEQEGVAVNTFYNWAKRLRSPAVTAAKSSSAPCKAGDSMPESFGGRPGAVAPTVRFRWNAAVEVLVPADCLDAIRCLAECFKHVPAERSDAFQEVVVRS